MIFFSAEKISFPFRLPIDAFRSFWNMPADKVSHFGRVQKSAYRDRSAVRRQRERMSRHFYGFDVLEGKGLFLAPSVPDDERIPLDCKLCFPVEAQENDRKDSQRKSA